MATADYNRYGACNRELSSQTLLAEGEVPSCATKVRVGDNVLLLDYAVIQQRSYRIGQSEPVVKDAEACPKHRLGREFALPPGARASPRRGAKSRQS